MLRRSQSNTINLRSSGLLVRIAQWLCSYPLQHLSPLSPRGLVLQALVRQRLAQCLVAHQYSLFPLSTFTSLVLRSQPPPWRRPLRSMLLIIVWVSLLTKIQSIQSIHLLVVKENGSHIPCRLMTMVDPLSITSSLPQSPWRDRFSQ